MSSARNHVAVNDDVVACDMAHVPLDDETLDVAIFSLSLMGANFADYLREAYRTLKRDAIHLKRPLGIDPILPQVS